MWRCGWPGRPGPTRSSTAMPRRTRSSTSPAAAGVLESQFGSLPYCEGDYLVIPRGIIHRMRPSGDLQIHLVIESRAYVRTPRRYRNRHGQLLEHSPFCERDIRLPREPAGPRPGRAISRSSRGGTRSAIGSSWTTIPWTRWAGTGSTFPGRSVSTTSNRSSADCTSHRRCIRPSRRMVSWSAHSCRDFSTSTRRRCRLRTAIRT